MCIGTAGRGSGHIDRVFVVIYITIKGKIGKVDQRNRSLTEKTCNDTQSHSGRIVHLVYSYLC